jgi:crossover junction endodeoxyribonuclease RuvC
MIFIGIDPGLSGGITITKDGSLLHCSPTPTFKTDKHTKYDTGRMVNILKAAKQSGPCMAYIERVSSRPGQGVTSMFTFGRGVGIWIGMLAYAEIPVTEVLPQAWKKLMLQGLDKSDKKSSILRATQLLPGFSFLATERSTVPHDGMAESYLIAEYGRRQHGPGDEEDNKENKYTDHRTLLVRSRDLPVV